MELGYEVRDPVYNGPLEGLLDAARKKDTLLSNLSLSFLIDDFLLYIKNHQDHNLLAVSEYLLMFSELIRIKTRTLLPQTSVPRDDKQEPRDLGPSSHFREAARELRDRAEKRSRMYDTQPDLPELVTGGETHYREITLFELVRAFQKVVITNQDRSLSDFNLTNEWDTTQQMEYIQQRFQHRTQLGFRSLLSESPSREEIIVTFLAILQLIKQNQLRLLKNTQTDQIVVVGGNG